MLVEDAQRLVDYRLETLGCARARGVACEEVEDMAQGGRHKGRVETRLRHGAHSWRDVEYVELRTGEEKLQGLGGRLAILFQVGSGGDVGRQ